ncbi:MAG: bifunctional serine/threonine protein kinase/MFS transporter [Pyrinomonadaceae bacterium]
MMLGNFFSELFPMNKCPRCLKVLPRRAHLCPECGFSLVAEITETISLLGLDETGATRILESKTMTPEKWQKLKGLFEAAQEIPAAGRDAFLRQACGGDSDLRREVEKLLGSFDEAEEFLEEPAVAEAGTLFKQKETLIANQITGEAENGHFIAGTVLDGRYRILGLLGKGGMGEVYKAEDLKLGQTVALKFLPEKLEKNREALKRFVDEVRTARQVAHQNVCKVYDIGEMGGKHFLSMEFIDGDDLSQLLRRIGRLPSERAAEISRQICFGLNAIHDADILHRDLKPANIIIDSRGKARITDFGIAGIEREIRGKGEIIGTPAYMSPEQITGGELTARSDIYSLGLLLYEIYTGKQVFQADSLADLIEKHKTTQPTNPSEFVENIDPMVEKTINRCLEKDPADRPKSALQVALALPGGNPLEAAIAAGETPSPEMVAAAPKKGALKPKLALGLLLAFLVVYVLSIINQQWSKTFNFSSPQKQPAVLAEKSREILRKIGYADPAAHTAFGFHENNDYLNFANGEIVAGKTTNSEVKKTLASGRVPDLNFIYRQSPEYLEPKLTGKVTDSDPALNVPNMVSLTLDQNGRLLELVAVPPPDSKPAEGRETAWSELFAEAGLDFAAFQQIEPKHTPPVFADTRKAWTGQLPELPDISFRVEAASLNGKPVFFRLTAPWNEKTIGTQPESNIFRQSGVILIILIYFLVIIGSILLARHNLKIGRGDLRGALKLSVFLFSISFGGQFLYADHVPTVWGELDVLYLIFARSLITSLMIGLIYIALEPFVRRYWSELLISWNRLLKGDFRDPLIGRDVLFGLLLGTGHTIGIFVGSMLFALVTGNEGVLGVAYQFHPANGISGSIFNLTGFLASSISISFIFLFILLGIYLLTKKKNLSIFLTFFLVFGLQGLIFVLTQHWTYGFAALINAACFIIALYRFGLVGLISFWLGFYFTYLMPLTLDSASLYFPNTILMLLVNSALAVYAFYISTAGRSLFGQKIFKDLGD